MNVFSCIKIILTAPSGNDQFGPVEVNGEIGDREILDRFCILERNVGQQRRRDLSIEVLQLQRGIGAFVDVLVEAGVAQCQFLQEVLVGTCAE